MVTEFHDFSRGYDRRTREFQAGTRNTEDKGHQCRWRWWYTEREHCDGLSLTSPGRWPPSQRVSPVFSSKLWLHVSLRLKAVADFSGSGEAISLPIRGRQYLSTGRYDHQGAGVGWAETGAASFSPSSTTLSGRSPSLN